MKKKRILSLLLVVAIVFNFLPTVGVVNAQTVETDAFGIKMDTSLTEAEKKTNPLGTDDWFPLFSVSELFIARGYSNTRHTNTYNYNQDGKTGSIGSVTTGTSVGSKSESNKTGFTMMDTAACDVLGEGQKRYIATIAWWDGARHMQLFLTDQYGNRVSDVVQIGSKDTMDYLDEADTYESTGFVSVTAGDFDGDGKDSIIIYAPEMEKRSPHIDEYKIEKEGNNIKLVKSGTIANPYGLIGTDDLGGARTNNGRVFRNTPVVQLVSADTDNDNIDELVITTGMNNPYDDVNNRQSFTYIYDYITEKKQWNQSHKLDTKGYTGGYNGAQRLRWASSAVGNIVSSSGTDFPEIFTAGYIDKNGGNGDSLQHAIGSYITSCTEVDNSTGTPIGKYTSSQINYIEPSGFTSGGYYTGDNVQSLLSTTLFAARGANYSDYIAISDTVYEYTSGGGLQKVYRDEYFEKSDKGIGSKIISNALVQDMVSGNFDGNTDGREQLIFSTTLKQNSFNNYFHKIYTYQLDESGKWKCDSTNYIIDYESNSYLSLCAPDIDNDSTIVRLKNVSKTYTEPEVLALLEAPPYFEEVNDGDIGNSETAFGKSESVENSTSTSNGLSANVIAGFEWSMDDIFAGFACGAGFESTLEQSWTWETTESTSLTYELNASNDSGDNAVLVYRRPVLTYEYELKNSDSTMVLAKEGTLSHSMISLDAYNAAAEQYGLDLISDSVLATPGDPFSYRSSVLGLDNVVTKDGSTVSWGGSGALGTMSQSFTKGTSTEEAFTYEMNTSFTAYGMVFGAKAGGGAGYNTTSGNSTLNTTEITKTGAVTSKDPSIDEAYDFNWQFAHWTTDINGNNVPVLGYIVSDVTAPPSPPNNLAVQSISPTKATVSWDHGSRPADEYRVYQAFNDNAVPYFQVAVVDGTENSVVLSDLQPNTTYTYIVRSYSAPRGEFSVFGESVNSEELTFTTPPDGVEPLTITGPGNQEAKIGGNVRFEVDVSLPSNSYYGVAYQWQQRKGSSGWQNIAGATNNILKVSNVQESDNGTQYRCAVYARYGGTLLYYYSPMASLIVGRTSVNTMLSIDGMANNGNTGTVDNPYIGKSNRLFETGKDEKEISTIINVMVPATADTPKLTVYSYDNVYPYIGIGIDKNGNTVYYSLTKSGDSYSIGRLITAQQITKYLSDDDKTEISMPEKFDGNNPISLTSGDMFYNLVALVEGTNKIPDNAGSTVIDTRLDTMTDINYYWYNGETYYEYTDATNVGQEIIDASKLEELASSYSVYYMDSNTIVLGRTDTWTQQDNGEYDNISGYRFYHCAINTDLDNAITYAVKATQAHTSMIYTIGDKAINFDPGKLIEVTTTETKVISTPIYDTEFGNSLLLKTQVTEASGAAAVDCTVDFRIKNTNTGAITVLTSKTDARGNTQVQWNAPTPGLYSIQGVVQPVGGYSTSQSAIKYYDAYQDNATEYQLKLISGGGATLSGSIAYGDTVGLTLQERIITEGTVNEWEDYNTSDAILYTVTSPDGSEEELKSNGIYIPKLAGNYIFRAYRNEKALENIIAAAALEVTRIAVSITPEWQEGSVPTRPEEVELIAEPAINNVDLKDVFDIQCAYFGNTNASGRFGVTLKYKNTSEAIKFKNNYIAYLNSNSFMIKPNSAPVVYSSGENGSITGRYSTNLYPMTSGSAQTTGTKLSFDANPVAGYVVDKWIINGVPYSGNDELPDSFTLNANRRTLTIASFDASENGNHLGADGKLTIEVSFRSANNTIIYGVNGDGGTISAVINDGNNTPLQSGTAVALDASVTFHATPDPNYTISGWMVDGVPYTWEDTDEIYCGTKITLDNINSPHTVVVSFKEIKENYSVVTMVYDENGNPNSALATISAVHRETGEPITDLTSLPEGSSITLTAHLTSSSTNTVKEWQISTDEGQTFTVIPNSGGQQSLSFYNIDSNMQIRVIVTNAQSFKLTYKVMLNGTEVTEHNIAKLEASSNKQSLVSGGEHPAYIPVDFALTLHDDYYVSTWSNNVTVNADNNRIAKLPSLTTETEVRVEIQEKPQVKVKDSDGGKISVAATFAGEAIIISEDNPSHIEYGSDITISVKPIDTYYVDQIKANGIVVFNSKDNALTDIKVDNITEDTIVEVSYLEKPQVSATHSQEGKISIAATLVGKDITISEDKPSHVEYGSDITISVKPIDTHYVDQIKVNGTVVFNSKNDSLTDIKVDNITENTTVEVAYLEKPQVSVGSSENGKTSVEARLVGKNVDILEGNASHVENDSTITITADPNDDFYVSEIKANGTVVFADSKDTYTSDYQKDVILDNITINTVIEVVYAEKPVVTFIGDSGIDVMTTSSLTTGMHIDKYSNNLTFVATPQMGFETANWTVNNHLVDTVDVNSTANDNTTHTIKNDIVTDVNVVVTSKGIPKFNLIVTTEAIDSNGAHGTVSAKISRKSLDEYTQSSVEGSATYYRDSDITITAIPDAGYRVQTWTIDGVPQSTTDNTITLNRVQKGHTVSVRFVKSGNGISFGPTNPNTIGGYISKAKVGNTNVLDNANGLTLAKGSKLFLEAIASAGYEISYWSANGVKIPGTDGKIQYTYTSEDATQGIHFSPVFIQKEYTINFGAINGTVTSSINNGDKVRGGMKLTFSVIPDISYSILNWTVNGQEQANSTSDTFTWTVPNGYIIDPSVTTYDVSPTLSKSSCIVTLDQAEHGVVTMSTSSQVAPGTEITFYATPDTGYRLAGWLVNGNINDTTTDLTLKVFADTTIKPIFELGKINVFYSVNGTNGTIAAKTLNGSHIADGSIAPYGSTITFTVVPEDTSHMVESWSVNNSIVSSMTEDGDAPMTWTIDNITEETTVSVTLVEAPVYTVSYNAWENGNVTSSDGEYGASYVTRNDSISIIAVPEDYYQFSHWIINGEEDQTSGDVLTLSNVKKDYTIEAVFKEAVYYTLTFEDVSYRVTTGAAITISTGGTEIYPGSTPDTAASVLGGSTIVFTAYPIRDTMVAQWTVNGIIQETLSNIFAMDKLTNNSSVTVEFVEYEGYDIPSNGEGYTITNIVRTPSDTNPSNEIRKNGTLTFTVTPDTGMYLKELRLNGIDCLTTSPTQFVTTSFAYYIENELDVVNNLDGSFTITLANITREMLLEVNSAMIPVYQLAINGLDSMPDELLGIYGSLEEIQLALRTLLKKEDSHIADSNIALFDIRLEYSDDGGLTWQTVTKDNFPEDGVTIDIPYSQLGNSDESYDFTILHMFISDMNGHMPGDTETISPIKMPEGIRFTVTSLSPFAIGWSKYIPPTPGGGGGGGGGPIAVKYTITATAGKGGAITPEGKISVTKGASQTFTITPNEGYIIEDVMIDGKSVGKIDTYTFTEVGENHTIDVRFTADSITGYKDVTENDWFKDAVDFVTKRGIMTGTEKGYFSPKLPTTRGMIVTILHRLENMPTVYIKANFDDVQENMYYNKAINWATANQIVKGYGNGKFGPNDLITREQMVAILYNYAQHKGYDTAESGRVSDLYTDYLLTSDYALSAMDWAVTNNILTGRPDKKLDPRTQVTRAEAAKMLMEFIQKFMK